MQIQMIEEEMFKTAGTIPNAPRFGPYLTRTLKSASDFDPWMAGSILARN
jgi:hypothetical protein